MSSKITKTKIFSDAGDGVWMPEKEFNADLEDCNKAFESMKSPTGKKMFWKSAWTPWSNDTCKLYKFLFQDQ